MTTAELVHIASDNGVSTPVKVPPDITEWGDRKLDNWINRTANTAGTHRAAFERHAVLTGYGLMVRRERCGSRKFKPWLDAHFEGSSWTAYQYIRAAELVGLSVRSTTQIEPPEEAEVVEGEVIEIRSGDYDRAIAGLDAALAYVQMVRGCAFPVALIERAHKLVQIIQRADGGQEENEDDA